MGIQPQILANKRLQLNLNINFNVNITENGAQSRAEATLEATREDVPGDLVDIQDAKALVPPAKKTVPESVL